MPVLGLDHFNLRADPALTARLREFYVEVIGLHEGWRPPFDFPGHWLYAGEQPVLHLVADASMPAPPSPPRSALDHVALRCSGLAEVEQRLRERAVAVRRSAVPGTAQVQLFVVDPAGNGVELNFADGC